MFPWQKNTMSGNSARIGRRTGFSEDDAMSHDAARMMLDTALRHIKEQNDVLFEIQAMCSKATCTQEEFNDYRLMVGHSIAVAYEQIIEPIIAKYPELTPPHMKGK